MISTLVLPIPKSGHEGVCVVEIDASKVVFVWVCLHEDAYSSLRSSIYWARIKNNCEAPYIAYDCEAIVDGEVVSRVYIIHLISCKYFSDVNDHVSLIHLLKPQLTN